jgi:hypothetical protein
MKKMYMLFTLLTLLLMGEFLQPLTVHASKNNTSEDSYTIHFFDKNGNEVRTWTGSMSEAKKILQVEDAKRRKGVSLSTNRVDGCLWPNSYFVAWNDGPLVCFANPGSLNVAIYNIYRVDTGNNTGNFIYSWAYLFHVTTYFGKNQTFYPAEGDYWTINSVQLG